MINKVEALTAPDKNFVRTRNKYWINKASILNLAVYILAFIMGRAVVFDGLAPFGLAFFAALMVNDRKRIKASLWVMLGLISNYQQIHLLKYVIALAMFCLLCIIAVRNKKRLGLGKACFFVSVSMITGGQIHTFIRGFLLYDAVIVVLEAVITVVIVYIFTKALYIFIQPNKRNLLSSEEVISLAVLISILTTGIFDYYIIGFSVKSVICMFIILLFSYIGGPGTGASIGLAIGILLSISSEVSPNIIGIYGFCGLLAGLLKRLGRLGAISGILMGNIILTFYINRSSDMIIQFQEIISASLVLLILPGSVMGYLMKYVDDEAFSSIDDKKSYSKKIKELTVNRLKEFSKVFDELAITFNQITDDNKALNHTDIADLFNNIAEKICISCAFYNVCWKREFYSTYQNMFELLSLLETGNCLDKDDLPGAFKKRCLKTNEIINSLNSIYELYSINYKWQKKVDESRNLIAQQLKGVSKVVEGLASELNVDIKFNSDIETELASVFDREGFNVQDVVAAELASGRIEIDITRERCNGSVLCIPTAEKIVSKALGHRFVCNIGKCLNEDKNKCHIKLMQAEKFNVTTGIKKSIKQGEQVSGDSYTFTPVKDGKYLLAISDGMGGGQRAYNESSSTISLLEQFLEAGFDEDTTIKTINSVLMLRAKDEMFATLDFCLMDLFSGICEFIKIGAAVSFIKRGDEVICINSNTLPIGIINDIDFKINNIRIKDGDFIIMVSDGIIESVNSLEYNEEHIKGFIKTIKTNNPKTIAEQIVNMAEKNYKGKIKDDLTVLVSRVWSYGI